MTERNKDFIKEPGMGIGGIALLILAVLVVFGALAYFLVFHGDVFSLPRPPQ